MFSKKSHMQLCIFYNQTPKFNSEYFVIFMDFFVVFSIPLRILWFLFQKSAVKRGIFCKH